jgi:hypothetical protein
VYADAEFIDSEALGNGHLRWDEATGRAPGGQGVGGAATREVGVTSLRHRIDRLRVAAGGDECRCRESHLGERLTAAEALALAADPDTRPPVLARCPECGGRVRVFITEVVVETREELDQLRAAGAPR